MKLQLEQVRINKQSQSFLCYTLTVPTFEFYWHYHPEYELTLIVKGKGKRLVGDHYEDFAEGDLVLLGPHLPHTWIGDSKEKDAYSAVVIQFSKEFIEPFLLLPEFADIGKLLARSTSGLYFPIPKRTKVPEAISAITQLHGVEAVTTLLSLLHKISKMKCQLLASDYFQPLKGKENEKRVNKVFQYVQHHFKSKISISKAASLIHLSESAFCKFFKKASGKTFSDYLNDIRVAHASVLLTDTDKPIASIAFECGFESQTYFNRVFYKKKKTTPREFRRW